MTPLLTNPNSPSLPIKWSPISLASCWRPSIIWACTSHPTVSCTSSLYTPLFQPKHTLCCSPNTFCIFHPCTFACALPCACNAFPGICISPILLTLPAATYSMPLMQRHQQWAHNLHTHALDTSSHWTPTKGESNFSLWSKRLGLVPLGLCSLPMVLHATPRLPITQNKRCCMNQCQHNVAIFFFLRWKSAPYNLLVQSWGTVSFSGPYTALTWLRGAGQYWVWRQQLKSQGSQGGSRDPRCPSVLPTWRCHETDDHHKPQWVNFCSFAP